MNYLALTIGPIYETMKYCKKTRELWVGSYFFSHFMRTLIGKMDYVQLIIPYVDEKKEILKKYKEEGVFHDRFIASSTQSKENLKTMIEQALSSTLEQVIVDLGVDDAYYDALKHYLQYSYIVATEEELLGSTGKENIIFAIDAILDSIELQYSFDYDNSTKVCKVDDRDYSIKRDGLVTPLAKLQYEAKSMKDIIKSEDNNYSFGFKSIPKIAVSEIVKNLSKDNEYTKILGKLQKDEEKFWTLEKDPYDTFYTAISKHDEFKPHHKYYAVVYADGDKMGSTIRNIYNGQNRDQEIKQFSKNIYEYISHDEADNGKSSLYKVIDTFGGMLIFAGGDDLLFFTPVIGKDGRTIFELLEEIASRFKTQMQIDAKHVEVSLSFGVSIQYYKSPMIASIERASSLLFGDAKAHNTQDKSGSVALALTKHSGQSFKSLFFLGDKVYKLYEALFRDELKENISLPHNLHYKLETFKTLIIQMFSDYPCEANSQLEMLFENLIKDGSQSDEAKKAIDRVQKYLCCIRPSTAEVYERFITQMAMIKFLRGDQ